MATQWALIVKQDDGTFKVKSDLLENSNQVFESYHYVKNWLKTQEFRQVYLCSVYEKWVKVTI